MALYKAGRTKPAIASLKVSLALDPTLADAAYSLGVLYEGRGDKANAVLAFQQAVRAKPDHSEALEALKRLGASPK